MTADPIEVMADELQRQGVVSTGKAFAVAKAQLAALRSSGLAVVPACPNCGEAGPHFAPPSFGEPGFYTCKRRASAPRQNQELG